MLNSPGPFAWKQLSSRFPTLLSPKHAKEQRRAFSVLQLSKASKLHSMSFINIAKKKKKGYNHVMSECESRSETPSIVLCRDCFASFRFLGLCVCPQRIWD